MPAKKAAKKAAKHRSPELHSMKDTRRAYEHLGRVGILQHSLTGEALVSVRTLAELSHCELQLGAYGNSADLLRAAEHIAFASLAIEEKEHLSRDLKRNIEVEREHLLLRAEDHLRPEADKASQIFALYTSSRQASDAALKRGCFHRAMEFARAAEALTHVEFDPKKKLKAGEGPLNLHTGS